MDNSPYGQQSLDGNLFALISDWNPSNLFEIRDVVFVIYNSLLFFIFILYIHIYIYLFLHIYIYLYIYIYTFRLSYLHIYIYVYCFIFIHIFRIFRVSICFFLRKAFIPASNPELRRIAAQRISLSCPPGGDFGSTPVTFFRYLAANIGVF